MLVAARWLGVVLCARSSCCIVGSLGSCNSSLHCALAVVKALVSSRRVRPVLLQGRFACVPLRVHGLVASGVVAIGVARLLVSGTTLLGSRTLIQD